MLLACTAALACSPPGPEGFLGAAPSPKPVRLLGSEATIVAPGDGAPAAAPLLDLRDGALEQWAVTSASGTLRYASPILARDGLPGAGVLRLSLRPGGATGVAVVPHPVGDQLVREHRALRRLEIPLEPGLDPDAPLALSIDLYEALHGSFGDAGRTGRLARLEILLEGADPERAALLRVGIEPRRTLPPGRPAARITADVGGALRPAWAIAPGAAVEIAIHLPSGDPELRWADAAPRGGGDRILEIVHRDGTDALAHLASTGTGHAPWAPHRASLARWAGERVWLRLRVEGAGPGLFGTPTLVAGPKNETPDVLVVLIDTLRADHLGVGGSLVPDVSPNLDRLAQAGVWFERAQSGSPWTKPAIATLMTGVQPLTHRIGATSYTDRLPASVPLLQERMRDAGWRTGSFAASPLGSTLSALERGFDLALPPRFWRDRARLDRNPAADQLGEALLDWIAEEPDRPFFAYLHALEVHEWKLPRYRERPAPGARGNAAASTRAPRGRGGTQRTGDRALRRSSRAAPLRAGLRRGCGRDARDRARSAAAARDRSRAREPRACCRAGSPRRSRCASPRPACAPAGAERWQGVGPCSSSHRCGG